jgi:hypothetical protein
VLERPEPGTARTACSTRAASFPANSAIGSGLEEEVERNLDVEIALEPVLDLQSHDRIETELRDERLGRHARWLDTQRRRQVAAHALENESLTCGGFGNLQIRGRQVARVRVRRGVVLRSTNDRLRH